MRPARLNSYKAQAPAGQSQPIRFPAPVKGLVDALPPTAPDAMGAEELTNFLPTSRGIRVRGGTERAAQVDGAVKTLFAFNASADKFFAATASAIHDISSLNPAAVAATVVDGMTSGDWSVQQVGVSGGDYLIGVNGVDRGQIFDGTDWHPWVGVAINDLGYDALTTDFALGETVTGGTSGATATIQGIVKASATAGTLKLGPITGTFQDNEAITSASGAAVVNGTASSASSITVSGVTTSTLSAVWLHQTRLFFTQANSLTAWYLPAAQVGGTANSLSLAGVFQRGGALLAGGTWSTDSGDGKDDLCVFISTEGEVAVYAGNDPSDANAWSLQGRYDIGKPLGKRGLMRAGGDLLIATDDGIVPLSMVVQRDPATLSLGAVTAPIRRAWQDEAQRATGGVELHRWPDQNLMLTVLPDATRMLTANLQTGAWAVQSGWDGTCGAVYLERGFVGRGDGYVYEINKGGRDNGDTFVASVCFSFSDAGDPTAYKIANLARLSYFAATPVSYRLTVGVDYSPQFGAAAPAADVATMVWGASVWGGAEWGGDVEEPRAAYVDRWRSVAGAGYALAPQVQITSGAAAALSVEVIAVDMMIEGGGRVS